MWWQKKKGQKTKGPKEWSTTMLPKVLYFECRINERFCDTNLHVRGW
jgi:hypothetical protein